MTHAEKIREALEGVVVGDCFCEEEINPPCANCKRIDEALLALDSLVAERELERKDSLRIFCVVVKAAGGKVSLPFGWSCENLELHSWENPEDGSLNFEVLSPSTEKGGDDGGG